MGVKQVLKNKLGLGREEERKEEFPIDSLTDSRPAKQPRQWSPLDYDFEPMYRRETGSTDAGQMESPYELYVRDRWELREKKPQHWELRKRVGPNTTLVKWFMYIEPTDVLWAESLFTKGMK